MAIVWKIVFSANTGKKCYNSDSTREIIKVGKSTLNASKHLHIPKKPTNTYIHLHILTYTYTYIHLHLSSFTYIQNDDHEVPVKQKLWVMDGTIDVVAKVSESEATPSKRNLHIHHLHKWIINCKFYAHVQRKNGLSSCS